MNTATCNSSSAVTDLLSHFDRSPALSHATGSSPLSTTSSFRSTPPSSTGLDQDFAQFVHGSPIKRQNDTLSDWLNTFAGSGDIDDPPSSLWGPEVQTALETQRSMAVSPALSAASYASELPTPEEAEFVCCESCQARSNGAHPLTCRPCTSAEWDFDRLFSRRRRWFGGHRIDTQIFDRVNGDTSEEVSHHKDVKMRDPSPLRGRSRSRSRSRLCQEIVPSPLESSLEMIEPEEVHEKLRESAMSRLTSVMRHLGWDNIGRSSSSA